MKRCKYYMILVMFFFLKYLWWSIKPSVIGARPVHVYYTVIFLCRTTETNQTRSIPVGCVPTAEVASTPGWGVDPYPRYPSPGYPTPPPKGHGTRDTTPPRKDLVSGIPYHPDRVTDNCENINFPQLRWRSVKIYLHLIERIWQIC